MSAGAQRTRSRRTRSVVTLAVLAAACVGCSGKAAPPVAQDFPTAEASNGETETLLSPVPLGTAAGDDRRQVTLVGSTCGLPAAGDAPVQRTAQGQFCRVDLRLANDGAKAATFSAASLSAVVGGTPVPADAVASVYAGAAPLVEVEGGQQADVSAWFDVPVTEAGLQQVQLAPGWLAAPVRFATT